MDSGRNNSHSYCYLPLSETFKAYLQFLCVSINHLQV
jgi:hypothetical protein